MRVSAVVSRLVVPTLVASALLMPAGAQEGTTPKPLPPPLAPKRGPRDGDVQKVFVLKNVRADDLAELLSVFPAQITNVERTGLSALSVSAAPAVLAAIEETIKRLDVPPPPARAVEVTGYVLECSAKAEGGSAPSELQDVVAQLKRTFGYAECGVGQTLFTRGSNHARFRSAAGSKPGSRDHPSETESAGTYVLEAGRVDIDGVQSPSVIRFRALSLQIIGSTAAFSADVDVRDGQKVVLGKLGSVSGKDAMLVLTARVVD
jgi:hypothetical protein